jgi:ketoreductase RED2
MNLAGSVAIVSGSSSGIGEAVARRLADEGASVVINSRSSEREGHAVADSLHDAIYVQGDMTDDEDARALAEAARSRWGRIDAVVNNAGTTIQIAHGDLESVTDDVWDRILHTNVLGAWHLTRAAAPDLRASGAGAVVNVSSLAGSIVAGSSIPYAVSKAALDHLTRLLARALAPEIRVNAVAPGLVVDTAWNDAWIDIARPGWEERNPLGRSGTPAEVAATVQHLLTAEYMTGQVIALDGGHSLL